MTGQPCEASVHPDGLWPLKPTLPGSCSNLAAPDLSPHHLSPSGSAWSNNQKDISGMFFLYSHFLRINGLIDADSLQNKRGRGGVGEMNKPPAPPHGLPAR